MCGPKPMINATLNVLHTMDVTDKDISYESA